MASMRANIDQTSRRLTLAFRPLRARWTSLEPRQRSLLTYIAMLVLAALVLAYVLMPALNTRQTMNARLPQLEAQLSTMQTQAKEIASLTKEPALAVVHGIPASIGALQSIFGTDAQITTVPEGFRVVIASVAYANWWDKTGEAVSRHGLIVREASMTRLDGPKTSATMVTVDMQLTPEGRAVSAGPAVPVK